MYTTLVRRLAIPERITVGLALSEKLLKEAKQLKVIARRTSGKSRERLQNCAEEKEFEARKLASLRQI